MMYSIYMSQILNSSMLKYYLEPIISSCELWKDKNLSVFIISNPVSGGFTQKKIAEKLDELRKIKLEKDIVQQLFLQLVLLL